MTGDRAGDLVFGINTGFSRYPRNVFIIIFRRIPWCPPRKRAFLGSLYLENLDEDPFSEIILNTSATDNFNDVSIPYSDSSSWLMCLIMTWILCFPRWNSGQDRQCVYHSGENRGKWWPCARRFCKVLPSGIPQGKMFTFDSKGRILQEEILMAGIDDSNLYSPALKDGRR